MGDHVCTFCNGDEGRRFSRSSSGDNHLIFGDHGWRFPDGILHYIEAHGFVPDLLFIDDVMNCVCTGGYRVQTRSGSSVKMIETGYLTEIRSMGNVPDGFIEKLLALMIKYDTTGNVKNFVCKQPVPVNGNLR